MARVYPVLCLVLVKRLRSFSKHCCLYRLPMHNWYFARVDVDYLGKKQNSHMDKSILTLKAILTLA